MTAPTARQREVLDALAKATAAEGPLSSRELSETIPAVDFYGWRQYADAERIHAQLKACQRHGWVEHVGVTSSGARTWKLTDSGRDVLGGDQ